MSFTYGGAPRDSDVDAVRFLVGDTVDAGHLLENEEIDWLQHMWGPKGSIFYVASMAAEGIAARFTKEISINADGQSISLGELQRKYLDLAIMLRDQHKDLLVGGTVHAGGMNAHEQPDPTTAPLAFGTRMHDHREAGRQDFGEVDGMEYGPGWEGIYP